ncbi:SctK family type III secretion system sorting platform protein [Pseudomonas maumuensis]|nr:SctK family type III secretion system sorting platform protein [Pseudomonas maumuensis]
MNQFQLRYCPAHYLHRAHCPEPLRQVAQVLPQWRQDSSINAWLLSVLGLAEPFAMPMQLGGLGLYPQPEFQGVLASLGGLLHGQAIQQRLDRAGQVYLRQALGEQGHRYCLEKCSLIIGPWPSGWQRALPSGALDDYLPICGLAFWLQACGEVDPGFVRRLALRLPGTDVLPVWPIDDEQRDLARILCLKVARDRSPQCCHLLN